MIEQKKIVVANFKMNLVLPFELENWLERFLFNKKKITFLKTQLVLCPPLQHFGIFVQKTKEKNIALGAQDCFWERKGAYTGANSPAGIKNFGGDYVILGHSERRKYFTETDDMINLKLKTATKVGLKTIVCVGEDLEERKKEQTARVIAKQLDGCLKDLPVGQLSRLLICYEPVWAISTNKPTALPSSDEIMTARLLIRKVLVEKYGQKGADQVKILYGGSVNPQNIRETCLNSAMDGVLVGKISLVPEELLGLVEKIEA